MPIVFVSPECQDNINELKDIILCFDYVFTSTKQDCQDLCDLITDEILSQNMFTAEKLDIENCSKNSWNFVMDKFSLCSGSVLIIAEKEYFNTLIPDFITNSWQTLSFDEKFLN